jgi:cellulose synthase/poly-beta-1,6-N-acetylglucosamine synthase-like glycosyltransferase
MHSFSNLQAFMLDILAIFSWLIAIPPTSLLLVFALEVWLGIWRTKPVDIREALPSTCVLIPAHNEASIIVGTLEHLKPSLSARTKALVVADNCTDETASLARQHGFEVIERFDAQAKGKGFALAFGREHLRSSPPECVIVMDADCRTDARSIAELARFSCSVRSAVQASYVFEPDPHASSKVQISNFALWIKNVVRQRGGRRAGGGAILTGTGMAFPWELFERMPLATENIVEDLSLTVDLARSGAAPLFLEQAQVVSAAASEVATIGQRSRWEQGFLAVAASHALPLLKYGLTGLDRKAMLLALHLLVPPLTLLLATSSLMIALLAGVSTFTGVWYPFALLSGAFLVALGGILINWGLEGHLWLTSRSLATLPLYFLWKLPVYAGLLAGKRVGWVRTGRD